jgi:hypothetical protein
MINSPNKSLVNLGCMVYLSAIGWHLKLSIGWVLAFSSFHCERAWLVIPIDWK